MTIVRDDLRQDYGSGHAARLAQQDDLDARVDRAIAAGRAARASVLAPDPEFDALLGSISPWALCEVGKEPVHIPTGTSGQAQQSSESADRARPAHRIELDPSNKRINKPRRRVRLEWPIPPSEVWTDQEWTFWPERSVPRYDFREWERYARSLLTSHLMTTGLVTLNRREAAEGRSDFGAVDVERLTAVLVAAASTLPLRGLWWDESQVVGVVPGLGSRAQAAKHYAGRRLPLSVLHASAARVAHVLLVGGGEPHRVWSRAERDAWRRWLARPVGPAPEVQVVTTPEERAYFSIHGHYRPVWRPQAQAFAELQAWRGSRSWTRRQPERSMLLELPGGLTAGQSVKALADRGVTVTSRTVTNWRKRLVSDGPVTVGQEPWRTTKGRPRNP